MRKHKKGNKNFSQIYSRCDPRYRPYADPSGRWDDLRAAKARDRYSYSYDCDQDGNIYSEYIPVKRTEKER